MTTKPWVRPSLLASTLALLVGCGSPGEEGNVASQTGAALGTRAQRQALVDTVLARSERREAFSPVKNQALGYDPLQAMAAVGDQVVEATTEEELFYALARLSHARRDRHLDVALVPGGLQLADPAGVDVWGGGEEVEPLRAPVRVLPDYGDEGGFFIGDVATSASVSLPAPGDRIIAVNGVPVAQWVERVTPWIRHSATIGLRWKLAEAMPLATATLPPELRADALRLDVVDASGAAAAFTLPYLEGGDLVWAGLSEPRYPGLSIHRSTPTWDLLLPDDGRLFAVLVWRGFRETMVADVDTLVALADRKGLLGHDLIVDVTRSRGGSLGPYAIQRLQARPFKTTFGNVRVSDVIALFAEEKRADFAARNINDGGVPETIDDGGWLMAWLDEDVSAALERGDDYTAPVPFKLAHAPKDSDGILPPAPLHFRGGFAVISGPSGGSHLDQFNAIVKDNGLGPLVGMPAGGYSNTWEWEEVLTMPGTGTPVVGFMYDIGHTLRPNGEILEGNPAQVDVWIPLTARGLTDYYARLLKAALATLEASRR